MKLNRILHVFIYQEIGDEILSHSKSFPLITRAIRPCNWLIKRGVYDGLWNYFTGRDFQLTMPVHGVFAKAASFTELQNRNSLPFA